MSADVWLALLSEEEIAQLLAEAHKRGRSFASGLELNDVDDVDKAYAASVISLAKRQGKDASGEDS